MTDGVPGDTLHTMFFDLTVDAVQRLDAYGDYAPAEGNAYVQVNVTVANPGQSEIPMADGDFTLRCGEDAEALWPADAVDDAMMPRSYALAAGASASYVLIFEVPASATSFALLTSDTYLDGANSTCTGSTYTVRFTV